MKTRLHYLILFSCLLAALPLTARPSYSQTPATITESDINAMLNRMDRAARKGNVAGIVAPFAKDIKIKMTMSAPGSDKEQVISLSKEQYAHNARQNMRLRVAYQLQRKNVRIKIYGDQQTAMVTSELYESFTIRQGTLRASASEVLIVSLQNGKVVIDSSDTRARLY